MMSVLKNQSCKRCGGNIFVVRDEDGQHRFCIQCGAVYYEEAYHPRKTPLPAAAASRSGQRSENLNS